MGCFLQLRQPQATGTSLNVYEQDLEDSHVITLCCIQITLTFINLKCCEMSNAYNYTLKLCYNPLSQHIRKNRVMREK